MSCLPPTLILCHATVLTMDPRRPRAEAIALRAGRIVAVGATAEVLALRGRATQLIDCRPQTVRSLRDLQAVLQHHSHRLPPGQWLMGYGYDESELAERRHPTRWDLDIAIPN